MGVYILVGKICSEYLKTVIVLCAFGGSESFVEKISNQRLPASIFVCDKNSAGHAATPNPKMQIGCFAGQPRMDDVVAR